jgi:LPXTG-site transpeptidase (sortase) family protein
MGPVSPAAGAPPISGPPISGPPTSGAPVSGTPVSPGQGVPPGYAVPGQGAAGQPAYFGPVPPAHPVSPGQSAGNDETTIIPAVGSEPGDLGIIPHAPADATGLIGIIPEVDVPEGEEAPKLKYKDTSGAPIRAVRMKDAYASAYSDYTRVTVGSVIRGTLRTAGELLITFGLVILLFAAYEVWGKTAIVDAHQNDLDHALTQEWDSQPVTQLPTTPTKELPPLPGNAIGRLYIPRLAKHWVIVEGVAPDDIRYAPGHYPGSAMPGEKGNFAMAGHRMRSVFWDLDQLETGDKIVVETQRAWFVYAVVKESIVKPTQVEVVSAQPPGVTPGKLLTLTTCNPKWDNYQRLIIHAELVGQQSRADGPPPELGG